jgi:hypothetical protein
LIPARLPFFYIFSVTFPPDSRTADVIPAQSLLKSNNISGGFYVSESTINPRFRFSSSFPSAKAHGGKVAEQGVTPSLSSLAPAHAPSLVPLSMREFLSMPTPERGFLLSPILPVQGIGIMYAPRGIGKTFAALSVAVAVASGGTVFNWRAPMPKKILYVDGEMPAIAMQTRGSSSNNRRRFTVWKKKPRP